jgi:hypothetical protein
MPTSNAKKTISQFNIDIENEKNKIKALDEQIKALKDEKRERKRKKYTDKNGRYYDPKKYTVDRDGHFHHRF